MNATRAARISPSRRRGFGCAIVLLFVASCATPDGPTNGTLQSFSNDVDSPVASPEASVADSTGVQPAHVAPQAEQIAAPAANPVEPPSAPTIERGEDEAENTGPEATIAQPPVADPVKPADGQSAQPPEPSAVTPHIVKEKPPQPLQEPSTSTTTERRSRSGTDESGPTASSPSVGVGQPTAAAPAQPTSTAINKRLSLDFKGADLDDLLRLISEVSGLNIVIAHGLKERKDRDVTVRLTNIEWRQALDVVLRAKGLSYEQDGNLIYVGSRSEIQKSKEERVKDIEQAALKELRIEEERRKIEEARRRVEEERRRAEAEERRYAEEPPCTTVIHVVYVKASDVKKHLERLKTRRGGIELEETTNSLIAHDVESVCLKMAALAKELDMPPKEPFVTRLLPFNYAKATDLKAYLTALKTRDGSVIVDERSSRIIVKDLPETVERMEAFLKQIDIAMPQVVIEARIVEATRVFSQSLGIQWGGTGVATSPGSATGVTVFGGSTAGSIRFPGLISTPGNPFPSTGGGVPYMGPVPLAVNLPVTSPHFAIGMTIGSLANRFLVGAQLTAAESQGKIRTLSSPRVATQDNEEAEIKQGTQVPYTTIDASGRTVVQFQDAFIKLKVKPHITPDGRVAMKVEAERSFPGQRVDFVGGFVFPINTRKATTNIMVQNGSTVVIGGLLQSSETIINDQVPALGNIPGLGWLFKRRTLGPDERVELLIFLTPSVLYESRS